MSNRDYSKPTVKDLGTVSEMTLDNIPKTGVSGDVITINGQNISVPGSAIVK